MPSERLAGPAQVKNIQRLQPAENLVRVSSVHRIAIVPLYLPDDVKG